jgi:cell wall-associated NlpC family hydrolase
MAKALSEQAFSRRTLGTAALLTLAGCGSAPSRREAAVLSPFERRRTPETAPDPRIADMLVAAIGLVGVPYRLGGNTADNGFDCSGLTRYLYLTHLKVTLPRRSHEQAGAAGFVDVPDFELQAGDLVFFNTQQRANSHVGVYVGDARFLHAPRTGALVRLEAMRSGWWLARYDGGRRLAALG